MSYKCIQLRGTDASEIKTEIMYEIASARVGGTELLRVNVCCDDAARCNKATGALHRILRAMKSKGQIQFFATDSSFEQLSMEAEYLLNKYPFLHDREESQGGAQDFTYIRI